MTDLDRIEIWARHCGHYQMAKLLANFRQFMQNNPGFDFAQWIKDAK